ncbi:NAD(P)H-dependent oxidoreductase [Sphingomonas sp. ST-64]|uniref:NAD(P)H-dependent oxidoreductase n=1 Tax=Sphingomonas plantiphila TaxID=3163295 RepID=A0ABW8YNI8_9SPHN
MSPSPPYILGIGGTTRVGSSSEFVLRSALARIEDLGVATRCVAGPDLVLPIYEAGAADRSQAAAALVALMRDSAGVVIASPGYHGTISGLVKNALDYAEDLAGDPSPYLSGKPVGCIACAYGWQATGSTLATLRTVAHALRGWPTPLGIAVNSLALASGPHSSLPPEIDASLNILAGQMVERLVLC